ncbi:hypothetical protein [Frankia sp. Cppng1_Ct_nod]|uniref:hypothetical protein n=1 Tax=Frankia sp. Cppng1_Ct_nod TaxID=2897162 RepID=UPI001041AB79|nr:hypothetical protein [Frankia sp. Cppng1_Ct_nod]
MVRTAASGVISVALDPQIKSNRMVAVPSALAPILNEKPHSVLVRATYDVQEISEQLGRGRRTGSDPGKTCANADLT